MFYFLFTFKLICKLFLVVVLCEQFKLHAFQTNKKLKREPCWTKDWPNTVCRTNHSSWLLFKQNKLTFTVAFSIEIIFLIITHSARQMFVLPGCKRQNGGR